MRCGPVVDVVVTKKMLAKYNKIINKKFSKMRGGGCELVPGGAVVEIVTTTEFEAAGFAGKDFTKNIR